MPIQIYYIVLKGRKPSIYDTWPECQKQVNDFKSNVYQSHECLLDVETTYNEYKQMYEKLPKRPNMSETTKSIMETYEKRGAN